jgi:hypothetical protein
LKIPNTKGAGGVAQMVQPLLSKYEALSSNPSTKKKRLMSDWGCGSVVERVSSTQEGMGSIPKARKMKSTQ